MQGILIPLQGRWDRSRTTQVVLLHPQRNLSAWKLLPCLQKGTQLCTHAQVVSEEQNLEWGLRHADQGSCILLLLSRVLMQALGGKGYRKASIDMEKGDTFFSGERGGL